MRLLLIFCPLLLCGAPYYNVRDFGARGDGVTKDTAAIQKAIDAAEKEGGGIVVAPAGAYLSGTLRLKTNVTLELTSGSVLLASADEADFDPVEKLPYATPDDKETSYFHYALLAAENIHDFAITGAGVVDGNRTRRGGPKTIAIKNCEHVSIRGITVRNAPNYSISFIGTDHIDIDGVRILNGYADGIDPDSSKYVRIANSYIDSWDDAICPKASLALGKPRATEHLVVTNCILRSASNNFKFGTESGGDFKDVAFSNSTMLRRANSRPARSGISLESVDGSHIDGVVISNIAMRDVQTPVFIRLGARGRGMATPAGGSVANVSLTNIVATGGSVASSITGVPGFPVRNVTLSDIDFGMAGGGEFSSLEVPEAEGKYPEANMFGALPAYALYARHVEGLTLRNIKTRWEEPDRRPALVFDDVKDLEISGFRSQTGGGPQSVLWFHNVAGALVQANRVSPEIPIFLRVTGGASRDISVLGNDLRRAKKPVELGPGVAKEAVLLGRN